MRTPLPDVTPVSELAERPTKDLTSVAPLEGGHEDGVLMADLASANTLISRYVLMFLDADTGRRDLWSVESELELVDKLRRAAEGVEARSFKRLGAKAPWALG